MLVLIVLLNSANNQEGYDDESKIDVEDHEVHDRAGSTKKREKAKHVRTRGVYVRVPYCTS